MTTDAEKREAELEQTRQAWRDKKAKRPQPDAEALRKSALDTMRQDRQNPAKPEPQPAPQPAAAPAAKDSGDKAAGGAAS